jgi:histidinol-phosphate/aromatic aminotransferase/cobyric acid decarboxylase-like protein
VKRPGVPDGPLPAGAHGGDGARFAARLGVDPDDVVDLSASLNPCAPDVAALAAHHLRSLRRYPDPAVATAALAATLGVDTARLVLTNGGAEAIALVAGVSPEGRVDEPDFSLYARHLERVGTSGPRWRSNPHNPSGRLAPVDERAAVWDEAFYPLATGRWTRGDRDAIVVGSLTKTFACPGLRMGYVLAPSERLARRIRSRQPEWAVGSLACALLPELLDHADLPAWAAGVRARRAELVGVLHVHGLTPEPSDANFVLVRDAAGLRDHLARAAVLVRDTSGFGIAGGVRIAVPDARGLERLAHAIGGYGP